MPTWAPPLPSQRGFHECASRCFRVHADASDATLDACTKSCNARVESAYAALQAEMGRVQTRVQRDVTVCEDDARAEGAGSDSAIQAAFAPCAVSALRAAKDRVEGQTAGRLDASLRALRESKTEVE